MPITVLSVDIHATEGIVDAGGKAVDILLVLDFLPAIELTFFAVAFEQHKEVGGLNFEEQDVA